MLNMYQQITIKTLKKQGEKNTVIADRLGCHRNTVRNVLQKKLVIKQTRNKPSHFDSYREKIKEFLDKKVTRLRIHEILTEEYGFKRTYDSLCKYVKKEFPSKPVAYGVQISSPGEEGEVDFGYLGMLPNNDGGLSKTWIFIITLAFSRNSYYQLTYDQKVGTLIKALQKAFSFFGGIPKRVKVDNMKTAILKNQHYNLIFNQDFLEFGLHCGFVIKPCSPYHPEQKGKVEAGVKYVQNNFLKGREFNNRADMESRLKAWMVSYANQRIHGTTKKIPAEEFKRMGKQALQSLPEERFAFFQRAVRKVKSNCHLSFENNYYSVPGWLVGKEVTLRWNDHLLRVVYQSEQVALHYLAKQGKGEYLTVRSHLPDYKCFSQTEYQAKYEQKMVKIGAFAHQYFKKVLLTKDHYWFRSIRSILGLTKTYGHQQVNLSLKRALYFGVTNVATIRNICEKKLYLLDQEPELIKKSFSVKSESERDLSYYQLNQPITSKNAFRLLSGLRKRF